DVAHVGVSVDGLDVDGTGQDFLVEVGVLLGLHVAVVLLDGVAQGLLGEGGGSAAGAGGGGLSQLGQGVAVPDVAVVDHVLNGGAEHHVVQGSALDGGVAGAGTVGAGVDDVEDAVLKRQR